MAPGTTFGSAAALGATTLPSCSCGTASQSSSSASASAPASASLSTSSSSCARPSAVATNCSSSSRSPLAAPARRISRWPVVESGRRASSCAKTEPCFESAFFGSSKAHLRSCPTDSLALPADRHGTRRVSRRCKSSPGVVAVASMSGTPVRTTSVLVVGATGTLGRQVVRRALDEGYDVRCLVRSRPTPADFLRDWGATVANGDLSKPETLPATLVGIHTIIDCATGRPEEPIKKVDWDGKVALIQCAKAMGIQKFVFFSIHNCEKHPEVPLMEIKRCTEKYLADSGLNYTIIRLCGFMQGVIGQYAVPILEAKSVWGTDAPTRVAYMDTQDVARLTLSALRNPKTNNKSITLAGPRAWTTQEVISLCERLAGQDAKITTIPVGLLRITRIITRLFQWTADVADRLAFSEVLSSDAVFSAPMTDTYGLLGVDPKDTTTLERYLSEYYSQILRKLKEVKATSKQGDYYL